MAGIRARLLYTGDGRCLAPGELRWDGRGRITSVRRLRSAVRVEDVAVFPGLVCAHVHLQLPALPSGNRPRRFDAWVRAVMAARARSAPATERRHAVTALRALLRDGTTAVGEIDSTGQSPVALAAVPLAGRCFQELLGFDLGAVAARGLVAARVAAGTRRCPAGLSPHAPYSVSPALFEAAARRCRQLSVHTAEVPEEQQLLRAGTGPFAALLAELGRLPEDFRPPGVGAVEHLQRLGVLRRGTQLVHCQALRRGDKQRIADAGAAVTVCPGTITWFGRPAPPVPAWLAAGIPVSLGTDSLASNDRLSMRDELQRAAQLWPGLAPRTLLRMATEHGAEALSRPGLGRLRRGGPADLFCVRAGTDRLDPLLEALVHGALPTARTWLRGRPLASGP